MRDEYRRECCTVARREPHSPICWPLVCDMFKLFNPFIHIVLYRLARASLAAVRVRVCATRAACSTCYAPDGRSGSFALCDAYDSAARGRVAGSASAGGALERTIERAKPRRAAASVWTLALVAIPMYPVTVRLPFHFK